MKKIPVQVWAGLLFGIFFTLVPVSLFVLPVIGISDLVLHYLPVTSSPSGSSEAVVLHNLDALAMQESIVSYIVSFVVWFVIGFLLVSIFKSKDKSSRFRLISILVIFLVVSCLLTVMELGG